MIDWRHWHNEPFLIGALIFVGWLYALATGPLRPRLAPGQPYPQEAKWFYCALVIFYLAVGSPLDQIGERFLLSAHMVQHQLLIYGAALFCLLGLPPWLATRMTRRLPFRGVFRVLLHPVVCAIVYTAVLTLWHVPALYDAALQNKTVHILEHLMFFAAAVLYWWPLVSRSADFPRARFGAQVVYLFAVTIAMTPLFAFIAFSDNVLYPTYEYAPRIIAGFTPANDQLLGAVIMKSGSLAVTFVAGGVAFYRWYQATERREGSL